MTFDDKTDAVAFLERVEELADEYDVQKELLVQALPELFRKDAILWFRNNKRQCNTWNNFVREFKLFFFPVEYEKGLEDEITRRFQQPTENGREFIIQIQTMIRRLGRWSRTGELNCIFRHLLPEYRQYIRRSNIASVNELMHKYKSTKSWPKS